MWLIVSLLGIFLLFALLFVGGLPSTALTICVVLSAFGLAVLGLVCFHRASGRAVNLVRIFALCTYAPIVASRFYSIRGVDWPALVLDALILLSVICVRARRDT